MYICIYIRIVKQTLLINTALSTALHTDRGRRERPHTGASGRSGRSRGLGSSMTIISYYCFLLSLVIITIIILLNIIVILTNYMIVNDSYIIVIKGVLLPAGAAGAARASVRNKYVSVTQRIPKQHNIL